MKILFLTPWYPDDRQRNHGIFVQQQALAISELHQVVVISSKVDYSAFGFCKYSLTETDNGRVKEYRMLIKRSLPVYNQLNYFLLSTWIALKISKAFKPDLIHGNIGYPGAFWSWLVSRFLELNYVITEHTLVTNNFRSFFHKRIALFALRRATALITVSSSAAKLLQQHTKREVEVVPNMIKPENFSVKPFPEGTVRIGFLGGLHTKNHVKGLDVLLTCLAKIDKDFICLIGGDGWMKESYVKMAEQLGIHNKCVFVGAVLPEMVPSFMNDLHFLVNPSRFESFGIAILEAMASGLPVVSFANGGPQDFVTKDCGILVENQNADQLQKSIEWMMENYQNFDRQKMSNRVKENFSDQVFLRNIDRIYNRIRSESN
jgi:glycosyltransferase involved in cell wall biosynthesis